MAKRSRCRKAGSGKAKKHSSLNTQMSGQFPTQLAMELALESQRTTASEKILGVRRRWIEAPRFYLTCLYDTFLELSFIFLLLLMHRLYELYVLHPLPLGLKVASIALVSLLGILRIYFVVRFSVAQARSNFERYK